MELEDLLTEMRDQVIKTATEVSAIKEQLERGDRMFSVHEKRIDEIDAELNLFKGKLGTIILFLTVSASVIVNGIIYFVNTILLSK